MYMKLSIGGHAWKRRFFYTLGHNYHEAVLPGGAAMLANILGERANPVPLLHNALCEHLRLAEDGARSAGGLYVKEHAGWTAGDGAVNWKEIGFNGGTFGGALVVWDQSVDEIHIPGGDYPVLWTSRTILPEPDMILSIKDRCLLMLDSNVLRKSGAMISRQISWERTATDLVWQLMNNPEVCYLSQAKHIVVTFAEDAAVYIARDGLSVRPILVLNGGEAEETLHSKCSGGMPDTWVSMVSMMAAAFQDVMEGKKRPPLYAMLKNAERLLQTGYEQELLESGDFESWIDTDPPDTGNEYVIPVYDGSLGADPHYWRIGGETQGKKMFDVAFEYVREGEKAIDGLPRLTFGALTTVDRREIESYQNIKNLIADYAGSKAARPLSVAVFGAPGSGKSFGVTQIAKNVLPGIVEKLEFNVSQFAAAEDLAAAFHQVRDAVLRGKLPLVFFDEFDSDRDGRPLGWVKSFLMPMQDGKFKDESGEHPVGKCIFVFAGGTSASFEEFTGPINSENKEEQRRFKDSKGPDFVSRLRGTVNVLGPNPADNGDSSYILRRALLLRDLCKQKLPVKAGRIPISTDVLRAMLLVPKYKHGARSMEAILDMSRTDGAGLEPALLPSHAQLSLHVDADAFLRLVLNESRLNSFAEKLAGAIHGNYAAKQKSRGDGGPYVHMSWEALPEDVRENNRRQAYSISQKLRAVGLSYDAGDTPYPSVTELTEEEVLVLARLEHDLWMADRKAAGYRYHAVRNDFPNSVTDEKTGEEIPPLAHPDMLPWEQLGVEARQKDIDTVKNIIPLLESIGLRVYRTV